MSRLWRRRTDGRRKVENSAVFWIESETAITNRSDCNSTNNQILIVWPGCYQDDWANFDLMVNLQSRAKMRKAVVELPGVTNLLSTFSSTPTSATISMSTSFALASLKARHINQVSTIGVSLWVSDKAWQRSDLCQIKIPSEMEVAPPRYKLMTLFWLLTQWHLCLFIGPGSFWNWSWS